MAKLDKDKAHDNPDGNHGVGKGVACVRQQDVAVQALAHFALVGGNADVDAQGAHHNHIRHKRDRSVVVTRDKRGDGA